jgi:hypothetical protein
MKLYFAIIYFFVLVLVTLAFDIYDSDDYDQLTTTRPPRRRTQRKRKYKDAKTAYNFYGWREVPPIPVYPENWPINNNGYNQPVQLPTEILNNQWFIPTQSPILPAITEPQNINWFNNNNNWWNNNNLNNWNNQENNADKNNNNNDNNNWWERPQLPQPQPYPPPYKPPQQFPFPQQPTPYPYPQPPFQQPNPFPQQPPQPPIQKPNNPFPQQPQSFTQPPVQQTQQPVNKPQPQPHIPPPILPAIIPSPSPITPVPAPVPQPPPPPYQPSGIVFLIIILLNNLVHFTLGSGYDVDENCMKCLCFVSSHYKIFWYYHN